MKIKKLPKPTKATIQVPGSKSYLNRALICASLCEGESTILNPNFCQDVEVMIKALQQLGVKIESENDRLIVHGNGGDFQAPEDSVHTENAGTTTRFLLPHLPTGTTLTGNEDMQKRPLCPLLLALEKIGFEFESSTGCPPVKVLTVSTMGGEIEIEPSMSSQFISSLMMIAPTFKKGLKIHLRGSVVSELYLKMTREVMESFGIHFEGDIGQYRLQNLDPTIYIPPQKYQPTTYKTPADASSATYWWTLAAMNKSQIDVSNIDLSLQQADLKYLEVLEKMGCHVEGSKVTGPQKLQPVEVDLGDFPDAALSLAVLAAVTPGTTVIKNIAHLKHKEVDRLQGLKENLEAVGISIEASDDSLTIHGGTPLKPAEIKTYNDHRFAMAFAILGMVSGGILIDNLNCVEKSYPKFFEDLEKILNISENQNLVITGMRSSGKSLLAKKLKGEFEVEMLDLDDLIELEVGKTISQIVEEEGWELFRKMEHETFQKIMEKKNQIISTGGGTLIQENNQPLISDHYVFLTHAPIETIIEWMKKFPKETQRPGLVGDPIEETRTIYAERENIYLELADFIYDSRELS